MLLNSGVAGNDDEKRQADVGALSEQRLGGGSNESHY